MESGEVQGLNQMARVWNACLWSPVESTPLPSVAAAVVLNTVV